MSDVAPEECIDAVRAMPPAGRRLHGICCLGALASPGMERCTCWEPVYDAEQVQPDIRPGGLDVRPSMCGTCAYRPGSPERSADQAHNCAAEEPGGLPDVPPGGVFFCHQGARRIVGWEHTETGHRVEARSGDYYRPPVEKIGLGPLALSVPVKADGAPADICAGWAAHRKAAAT